MGATVIHSGVKLDNLVQIAHNDEIGSHTVMAAQVGIAGSTKVGEWCMFLSLIHISIVESISERYIELFENITGEKFVKEDTSNIAERIEKNVMAFLAK